MRSWKTTITGISVLVAIISKIVSQGTSALTTEDVALAIGAIGLILAKDFDVSGLLKR